MTSAWPPSPSATAWRSRSSGPARLPPMSVRSNARSADAPRGATGIAVAVILAVTAILAGPARAITVPAGFVVENAVPGASFDTPTAIAFLPDGRMLVAEKRGRVWMVQNGVVAPAPLWHGEDEVLNVNDRGLLGLAVDPHYAQNHYLY